MNNNILWPVPSRPPDPRIDPALIDSPLREEVDLLMRLIEAANASDCCLDRAALDAVLFTDQRKATTTPPEA